MTRHLGTRLNQGLSKRGSTRGYNFRTNMIRPYLHIFVYIYISLFVLAGFYFICYPYFFFPHLSEFSNIPAYRINHDRIITASNNINSLGTTHCCASRCTAVVTQTISARRRPTMRLTRRTFTRQVFSVRRVVFKKNNKSPRDVTKTHIIRTPADIIEMRFFFFYYYYIFRCTRSHSIADISHMQMGTLGVAPQSIFAGKVVASNPPDPGIRTQYLFEYCLLCNKYRTIVQCFQKIITKCLFNQWRKMCSPPPTHP